MECFEALGLSCKETGTRTNRVMATIRHNGNYVAAFCYSILPFRKPWIWSDVTTDTSRLSTEQFAVIDAYLAKQTAFYNTKPFGDQQ